MLIDCEHTARAARLGSVDDLLMFGLRRFRVWAPTASALLVLLALWWGPSRLWLIHFEQHRVQQRIDDIVGHMPTLPTARPVPERTG